MLVKTDFDKTVATLRARLHSRMNGNTSSLMAAGQINYAINYGLSPEHIREIAAEMNYDFPTATQLFKLDIREAKIIALLSVADAHTTQLISWLPEVTTPEIAEQAAFHLFYRVDDLPTLLAQGPDQGNYALAVTALAAGRALLKQQQIPAPALTTFINNHIATKDNFTAVEIRGISLLLRQMYRQSINPDLINQIYNNFSTSNNPSKQTIAFELSTEMQ